MLFRQPNSKLFSIAGLWREESGVQKYTMLTTTPNESVAKYHDRMPFILKTEQYDLWLGDPSVAGERGAIAPWGLRPVKLATISAEAGVQTAKSLAKGLELSCGAGFDLKGEQEFRPENPGNAEKFKEGFVVIAAARVFSDADTATCEGIGELSVCDSRCD